MDPLRLGLGIRALRRRRSWRQQDLACRADTSTSTICRLEKGRLEGMTFGSVESVIRALGARLEVCLLWNGAGLDRLLDAGHARLVERTARFLAVAGWEPRPEVTFSVYGERGSHDILARHRATGLLATIEVKTEIADVQATLSAIDRKARLAPRSALDLGWSATGSVARILVIGDTRANRRRVAAHAATIASVMPAGGRAVRRWLRAPQPGRFGGVLFLSGLHQAAPGQQQRVRVGGAGAASCSPTVVAPAHRPANSADVPPPASTTADQTAGPVSCREVET
jgi:transcriptional regulator with XRE-family HTH domain